MHWLLLKQLQATLRTEQDGGGVAPQQRLHIGGSWLHGHSPWHETCCNCLKFLQRCFLIHDWYVPHLLLAPRVAQVGVGPAVSATDGLVVLCADAFVIEAIVACYPHSGTDGWSVWSAAVAWGKIWWRIRLAWAFSLA